MTARRLYITVALCAVVVYLGALWNQFALDDVPIIVVNPLSRSRRGFGGRSPRRTGRRSWAVTCTGR